MRRARYGTNQRPPPPPSTDPASPTRSEKSVSPSPSRSSTAPSSPPLRPPCWRICWCSSPRACPAPAVSRHCPARTCAWRGTRARSAPGSSAARWPGYRPVRSQRPVPARHCSGARHIWWCSQGQGGNAFNDRDDVAPSEMVACLMSVRRLRHLRRTPFYRLDARRSCPRRNRAGSCGSRLTTREVVRTRPRANRGRSLSANARLTLCHLSRQSMHAEKPDQAKPDYCSALSR